MSVSCAYMKHEDAELGPLGRFALRPGCRFNIFLQFSDGVVKSSSRIIHLIYYQYLLANEIGHLEAA